MYQDKVKSHLKLNVKCLEQHFECLLQLLEHKDMYAYFAETQRIKKFALPVKGSLHVGERIPCQRSSRLNKKAEIFYPTSQHNSKNATFSCEKS